MNFLQLQSLHKTYPGGVSAVKGVSLEVQQGQFIVLLGPSGCGKTTTLRMVAGLELATAGSIRLAGRDVTALPPSQRDVGFVFQFYALYPHLTVRDNIAFPLAAVGTPRRQRAEAVHRVADRLGITDLLARHPRQLSGGDQQRVALARAMVRTPALFLMDEPLGTLDADQRLDMREFIRQQQLDSGVTTLYVTHDQEEAMSLADRVVVMNQGQLQQDAPPADIYDRPANLFVAHFVGSPGMNFIAGSFRIDAPGPRLLPDHAPPDASLPLDLPQVPPAHVQHVTLGIRGEHLRLDPQGPLAANVLVDEYMGSHRNLHLDAGYARLIVRVPPGDRFPVGQPLRLTPDPQAIRLFDTRTGDAIL